MSRWRFGHLTTAAAVVTSFEIATVKRTPGELQPPINMDNTLIRGTDRMVSTFVTSRNDLSTCNDKSNTQPPTRYTVTQCRPLETTVKHQTKEFRSCCDAARFSKELRQHCWTHCVAQPNEQSINKIRWITNRYITNQHQSIWWSSKARLNESGILHARDMREGIPCKQIIVTTGLRRIGSTNKNRKYKNLTDGPRIRHMVRKYHRYVGVPLAFHKAKCHIELKRATLW